MVLEESQLEDWTLPHQATEKMKSNGGQIESREIGAEGGNAENNRPELPKRTGPP